MYRAVQILYNIFGWVGRCGDLLLCVIMVGGYFIVLLYNTIYVVESVFFIFRTYINGWSKTVCYITHGSVGLDKCYIVL